MRQLSITKLIICHKERQKLFSGTYDQFLEKIGWEEEKVERKKTKNKRPLTPKKEASRLEKKILSLENELSAIQVLITQATEKHEFDTVQELMHKKADLEKQVETSLEQLCQLDLV